MAQLISGPGIGLPFAQNMYPSALQNAPSDPSGSRIALAPGDTFVLPAGGYYITTGSYLIIQYLDPTTGQWSSGAAPGWGGNIQYVKSDGYTTRIANLTGCVYNMAIIAYGSGYVQASTTLTVTGPSNVTANPIVGGQLTLVGGTLTNNGAGYGKPPLVFIPPPPPPASNSNGVGGVPATAYAGITSGTVSFISFTNPGAGYPTAPTPVILPAPDDPNLAIGITQAIAAFSLVGSGSITGAVVTNHGNAIPDNSLANVTVAVGGAGTSASVVANVMQTVKAGSVVGTGLGYGTVGALLTTTGGAGSAGTITNNSQFLGLSFRPRPAQLNLVVTGGGTVAAQTGSVIDGGLFLSAPNAVVVTNPLPGANVTVSGATISFIMGSRPDIALVQPAPG